jgi:hypothetical protein
MRSINSVYNLVPYSLKIYFRASSHQHLFFPSFLFQSGLLIRTLRPFLTSHIRVTISVLLILLDVIVLVPTGQSTNYETQHYVIFSSLKLIPYVWSKYFPWNLMLKESAIWEQLKYARTYSSIEGFSGIISKKNCDKVLSSNSSIFVEASSNEDY